VYTDLAHLRSTYKCKKGAIRKRLHGEEWVARGTLGAGYDYIGAVKTEA
jgi:hypothetical protein